MRTPALFLVILVGAVGSATAQPKQEETSGRVSLKKPDARAPGDWVELASPTPAKHGTEFVVVGRDAGSFGKLRLDAARGRVVVLRVTVDFADGKRQTFKVNKMLDVKRQKSAVVELADAKAIDRVIVTTSRDTSGAYAVYGSSPGRVVAGR